MKYFLGIDLGTTGTKSMLFNENGDVLGRGYKSYELISTQASYYEQNPEDWYSAVCESVKEALNGKDYPIEALSFSAQGGSFFLADLDKNKNVVPLTNALTWMDVRASKQREELIQILGEDFSKSSGISIGPGLQACKIKWFKDNEPELLKKTKIILTTSDYIYYKLTNKFVIDYTSVAITGLFDIKNFRYNKKVLDAISIDESVLPKPVLAGEFIGYATKSALKDLGLDENSQVKIICGAHDQYAANIGSNYFNENDLLISTGTTWVVFGNSKTHPECKNFLIAPHPINGYGVICSAVSSGSVIEWEKKTYSTDYAEINSEVEKKQIEEDLFVYPFISGGGGYRNLGKLNYSCHNLSFRHDKFDIIKATMEGVCFEIKEIIKKFKALNIDYKKIVVAGGATKSPIWMQTLSSVLGEDIYVSNFADRCCFGAFAIAKKGCNNSYDNFEFDGKIIKPNLEDNKKYQVKFDKYTNYLEKISK